MSKRLCVWLLFMMSIAIIVIDCALQKPPIPVIPEPRSLVRVLTVENELNYPFYHTALELSYPGFNETYGFYSTYSGWRFWLYGWMSHQGVVKNPDVFTVGNIRVPAGNLRDPLISIYLNRNQTLTLQDSISKAMNNPGFYSYINREGIDNCVSWVEHLLNPILRGERLDCSWNNQIPFSVPSACRLSYA